MKEIIFSISFCLAGMFGYSQVVTNIHDIPVPPSEVVKKMSIHYKKVSEPTLTARCFGTINADGSVKNGSGNFNSHIYSGYYYVYIDSNLLKNSTIVVSANWAGHKCSYWIAPGNSIIYVAMHDISKNFTSLTQGEFNFVVFKR